MGFEVNYAFDPEESVLPVDHSSHSQSIVAIMTLLAQVFAEIVKESVVIMQSALITAILKVTNQIAFFL